MGKLPYMQFYTGDWLKDPNLSMCSPETRGIWADLLSAMHELDRIGLITGTTDQLARISRCNAVQFVHAIEELKITKTADVTERNGVFTIINRRMQREYKERVATSERVKKFRGNGLETPLKRERNGPSSESESESETNSDKGGLPAAAAAEKKSRHSAADLRRFTEAQSGINRPQKFLKFLETGAQDDEIDNFLTDDQKIQGQLSFDFEKELLARAEYLRVNSGNTLTDQEIFEDLEHHFKKLGRWDEVAARRILGPKGDNQQ